MKIILSALLALAAPAPATAATIAVTPASYPVALALAHPGDVFDAAAGVYPAVTVRGRVFAPPITLRATDAAVFGQLSLLGVEGFNVVGGCYCGNAPLGDGHYGILIRDSAHIAVAEALLDGNRKNLVITGSHDIAVARVEVSRAEVDGFVVSASQRVSFDHVQCWGGRPSLGAHADCFQGFSHLGEAALTDISFRNSSCTGPTQCANLFGNKVRPERIALTDNTATITQSQAFNLPLDCIDCTMTGNRAETMRGSTHIANITPIRILPGWSGTVAGNVISARPVVLPR